MDTKNYKHTSPELIKTIKHWLVDKDIKAGKFALDNNITESQMSEILNDKRGMNIKIAAILHKIMKIDATFILNNTK